MRVKAPFAVSPPVARKAKQDLNINKMIFLQKYWHLVVIAILAFALFVVYDWGRGQQMTAESRGSIIREQNAELEYRKSKEGKIIAEKEAAVAQVKDLKEAYPRLAKLLTEQMDIRLKNLRTSIQAEFQALNSGTSNIIRDTIFKEGKPVAFVDSVKVDDGYLNLDGILNPSNSGELKSLDWKYSYQDSVTIALHVKKKWFLGKETLYSSFMLQNPNAKVINSTSTQVQTYRDKRWVISAGAYYDPFRDQWGASVHFGRALFKF
jgi:hypothetical protein